MYVFLTYVFRILVLRSASIPYWTSSPVNAKNDSDRTTPNIKSNRDNLDSSLWRADGLAKMAGPKPLANTSSFGSSGGLPGPLSWPPETQNRFVYFTCSSICETKFYVSEAEIFSWSHISLTLIRETVHRSGLSKNSTNLGIRNLNFQIQKPIFCNLKSETTYCKL